MNGDKWQGEPDALCVVWRGGGHWLLDLVRGLGRASARVSVSLERKWQFWPTGRTNRHALLHTHRVPGLEGCQIGSRVQTSDHYLQSKNTSSSWIYTLEDQHGKQAARFYGERNKHIHQIDSHFSRPNLLTRLRAWSFRTDWSWCPSVHPRLSVRFSRFKMRYFCQESRRRRRRRCNRALTVTKGGFKWF